VVKKASMYEVKTPEFVGPLSLLLSLVKREELSIHDIPITDIILQYFQYLEAKRKIDLETCGEFLVLVSTLMEFKAKALLPHLESPSSSEEEEGGFEPSQEYEKLKIVVQELERRIKEQSKVFTSPPVEFKEDDWTLDVSLFDLMEAFRNLLTTREEPAEEIIQNELSIEEMKQEILQRLRGNKFLNFSRIFPAPATKMVLIATFLALLELIKERMVKVRQHKLFGNIRIYATVKREA